MDLIGKGRAAEIFARPDGLVLKLYFERIPAVLVEAAYETGRRVHESGVPTPEMHEIVEVGRRIGIVMDRVEGSTLFDAMLASPKRVSEFGAALARLHLAIHTRHIGCLPRFRDRCRAALETADPLTDPAREVAKARLAELPDGDRLRHGDLHPANVLITPAGDATAIDWDGASIGSAARDVTRTFFLLSSWALAPGPWDAAAIEPMRASLSRAYLDEYLRGAGGAVSPADVEAWKLPIAAARLRESIEEERDLVISQVEELISGELG